MNDYKEITKKFAHDLRNPLGGILGCAELLDLDLPENPKWKKRVSGILHAANKINELVSELQESVKVMVGDVESSQSEEVKEIIQFLMNHMRNEDDLKFSLDENSTCDTLTVTEKGSGHEVFSLKLPKKRRGAANA